MNSPRLIKASIAVYEASREKAWYNNFFKFGIPARGAIAQWLPLNTPLNVQTRGREEPYVR